MLRTLESNLLQGNASHGETPRGLFYVAVALGMDTIELIHGYQARSRQRQALRQLDDRLLADIAISREAARKEAGKWFWQ